MTIDVLTKVEIRRPRAEVAAFASDPNNATRWYRNIVSARPETSGPLEVGSRIAFEARFLGRRMAYTYEVVEIVPGERLVMSTAEGPFPMQTTYTFSDAPGGGTRMALRNRGGPSGILRLADPLMSVAVRRPATRDLRRLKAILEDRSGSSGSGSVPGFPRD
ncbi:MAG TPA: SRPBCC family protein [Actinomycetota bacterium]|jgi:uncharacterized protein YndB with AHSA1/START domain